MDKVNSILFCCHGNICRSPMAEFIMKWLISSNMETHIYIESAATSYEEYGNHIYPPARSKLKEKGIPYDNNKTARRITLEDYKRFDMIIAMEKVNIKNILKVVGGDPENKISLILDYTSRPGNVSDPWYTGDFERAYQDILSGCKGLLDTIEATREIE